MRPLSSCVERVHGLTARHEQTVALLADETQVGGTFRHDNLPDFLAVGRVDVDAVDTLAAESGCAPDIAIHVGADTVVEPGILYCKLATIGETPAVILDSERPDPCLLIREMRRRRVGHIQ